MADKHANSNHRNPFYEEDDEVDDFAFVSHPQQGRGGYVFDGEETRRKEAEKRAKKQQQLMAEMERIQQRSLDSSARSLGLVHESEQIGVTTAENLLHQREQLERSEANVSNINRALRSSQKHINSIKSVFSNFGSMFSKTPEPAPQPAVSDVEPSSTRSSALTQNVEAAKLQPTYSQKHPALKMRGIDYEVDSATDGPESIKQPGTMSAYEDQLDDNLGNLSLGLGRLKGLAIGLGDEIEEQNEILDRLSTGVDKADMGIGRQNKQMQKILKK